MVPTISQLSPHGRQGLILPAIPSSFLTYQSVLYFVFGDFSILGVCQSKDPDVLTPLES